MILYDWKAILRHSKGSAKNIVGIVDYLIDKDIPYSRFHTAWNWSQLDWSGDSFLLNPKPLVQLRYGNKMSNYDIAYYIALASLRNYPEFQATNKLSLDLLACLGKENAINKNSLLTIKDDQIHFKYEEAPQE
jgi:hypothetical protein